MLQPDIEGEARFILRSAGFSETDAPRGLALARALGIEVRATRGALVSCGDACFIELAGREFIFVRHGLSRERLNFALCHEVSEWHLRRYGYRGEDIERVADALGAALLVPGPLFRSAYRRHGEDWSTSASELQASQTLILLRFGEVTGHPVAVRTPDGWRMRGGDESEAGAIGWVASAIRRQGRRPLRMVALTDAPRRLAIYPEP
jgi:hypothetical protein